MAEAGRISRLSAWLDQVAMHWLGWSLPPVAQALTLSGWSVDEPDAYCPRCGSSTGAGEFSDRGCAGCRGQRLPYRRLVRLGGYAPPLAPWVAAVKYRQWTEMGAALGEQLGRAIREAQVIDLPRAVVVPMPMPWMRRLYRGIDHAQLLAQAVADEIGAPVISPLAKRNGPPQVGLPAGKRQGNLRRRLYLRRRWRRRTLADCDVVLVDDVRTTGTSLRAAARVLRVLKPRRVVAAVLAVADGPGRRQAPLVARADPGMPVIETFAVHPVTGSTPAGACSVDAATAVSAAPLPQGR